MSKSESENWIATIIPSQSSANNRKIDLVSDLLVPYSRIIGSFSKDIDLRFVHVITSYQNTQAKGYQTKEQFDALLVNCHNRCKANCKG